MQIFVSNDDVTMTVEHFEPGTVASRFRNGELTPFRIHLIRTMPGCKIELYSFLNRDEALQLIAALQWATAKDQEQKEI